MPIKEKKKKNRRINKCLMQITFNISCTLDRKIGGILSLYPHNRKLVMCLCDTKNKKMGTKKKKKRKRTKLRGLIVSTCYLNQGTVVWVNFPYSRAEVTRSCDRKKSHKSKKSASFQQQFYIWNYQKWCLMFWSIKCKSICVIYLHNNKRL